MGCNVPVQPRMLMCRPHWAKVPAKDKRAVWATYEPGQERRKDPSAAYLRAAIEAVIAVAIKDGHDKAAILAAPEVLLYRRTLRAMGEAPTDGDEQLSLEGLDP
jgi:hypothetical protein